MDPFIILGIVFIILLVLFLIGCIILERISIKDKKEGYALMENFEEIRKLKKTNHSEFIEKCFEIITTIKPGHWNGFRVKESRYGKGWFVEGDYFSEKRFWPSSDIFGSKYYPESYLSENRAENELLDVLEKLVDFIIYWENLGREFDAKRED